MAIRVRTHVPGPSQFDDARYHLLYGHVIFYLPTPFIYNIAYHHIGDVYSLHLAVDNAISERCDW